MAKTYTKVIKMNVNMRERVKNSGTDIESLLNLLSIDNSSQEEIARLTGIIDVDATINHAKIDGLVESDFDSGKFKLTDAGLNYLVGLGV